MALLLCDGIGKACRGLCDGLCHVINLPCRLCCKTCRVSCDCICQAVTSPFFFYLAVTCGFNFPPTFWGILAVASGCGHDADWLALNAIGTLSHIIAAFYIVHKVQEDDYGFGGFGGGNNNNSSKPQPSSGSSLPTATVYGGDMEDGGKKKEPTTGYEKLQESFGPNKSAVAVPVSSTNRFGGSSSSANSWSRLCETVSYDLGVAIYLVIFVIWMCWQGSGFSKALAAGFDGNGGDYGGNGGNCAHITKWMINSVILGWIFMSLVLISFCCSLFCLKPV